MKPAEGTITALAFGGKGILRTPEGKVVFIPFTIPGETIRYHVTKEKKHYAEGVLEELITKSCDRITPRCPYFTRCGGCQLQHLDQEAQTQYKKMAIEQALHTVFPEAQVAMAKAIKPWEYRRRVHLTLHPGKMGFDMGYIGLDNRSLIPISQCPIFTSPDDPVLKNTAEIASQFTAERGNEGKALLIKGEKGKYILHFHFKTAPKNGRQVIHHSLKPPFSAIKLSSPRTMISAGSDSMSFTINDFDVQYSSNAFVQNHPEESALIYQKIEQLITEAKPSRLLDLYSGIGISSLIASRIALAIDAVELNKEAVSLAKANAQAHQIENIAFHQGKVEDKLEKLLKDRPEMAICNPPREGMDKTACALLAASSIQEIVYISCHPATLARDLAVFKNRGFVLREAIGFDMFPQTGHVETIVSIKRQPCACVSSEETARDTG